MCRRSDIATQRDGSADDPYMLNDKQYIVVPTGGSNLPAELIALCLP